MVFFEIFKVVYTISCSKSAKNTLFLPKKWYKWKNFRWIFLFFVFFSSPHVSDDKLHSQKKMGILIFFGGYPEMCAWFPERIHWFDVQKPLKISNFPLKYGKNLLFLSVSQQKVVILHRLWTKQQKIVFKGLSETVFKFDLPFLEAELYRFLLSQLARYTLYCINS